MLVINGISVFLLLLFSIFLVTRNGRNRLSNLLLAGFLFINAVPFLLNVFALLKLRVFHSVPTLFLSIFNLDFLLGPLIYFYTKSVAAKDFAFKKKDWIHLLPIIIFNSYLIFSLLLKQTTRVSFDFIRWEITAALLVSHSILVMYACLSVCVVRRFSAAIKNVYSYMEKVSLSWLRFVLFGFGIIWLMIIVSAMVRIVLRTSIPYISDIIPAATLVVSTIIIYYGLTRPKLFADPDPSAKYLKSTLTAEDARVYSERLKEFMTTEKPHLTPSLTINELSEQLAIPAKHLSQLVNEQFKQNFFDFINSYRVEEAKRYLQKKGRNVLNISQILYEVGFNSKAAFNRAFSKHVGMSPKEFKKQSQMSA